MTRYTVTWHDDAQAELARLWNQSLLRRQITAAADNIDQVLAADPLKAGDQVSSLSRCLRIYPLAVLFHAREPDRIVEVFEVKLDVASM